MADSKDVSAPLTAAYDQARAASGERLDQLLTSVTRHTADQPPALAAVAVNMALAMLSADTLRELLHAAVIRLLEQGE
jgi:hypothetical protein